MDPSYLGLPYFNDLEVATTMTLDSTKTLAALVEEMLNDKLSRKKRVDNKDFRPCAAHDLAPILSGLLVLNRRIWQRTVFFRGF